MSKAANHRSERVYDVVLRLYPRSYRHEFEAEMRFVFSELLKDAYREAGNPGIFRLWFRTIVDAGTSLFIQHLENQKRGDTMLTKITDALIGSRGVLWVALATGFVLLIPLLAMQFTSEVNWTMMDFAAAGTLMFVMGLTYVLLARRMPQHRIAIAFLVGIVFVYLWAELAVGIFTNWGS